MSRVRNGRYALIPPREETLGHGTHSLPAVWGFHLEAFLKALAEPTVLFGKASDAAAAQAPPRVQ